MRFLRFLGILFSMLTVVAAGVGFIMLAAFNPALVVVVVVVIILACFAKAAWELSEYI